jgi:hypothetical protein
MPSHAHLRLLRELNKSGGDMNSGNNSGRPTRRLPPSAARMNFTAPGTHTSAMRAKVEAIKRDTGAGEATLRALTTFNKAQKKRTVLQAHQLDWYRVHRELQSERHALETDFSQWLREQLFADQRKPASGADDFQPKVPPRPPARIAADCADCAAACRRRWSTRWRRRTRRATSGARRCTRSCAGCASCVARPAPLRRRASWWARCAPRSTSRRAHQPRAPEPPPGPHARATAA